jgi:hypothetical protein
MRSFAPGSLIFVLCTACTIGIAHAQSQVAKQGDDNITHIFTFADKTMKLGDRTAIFREFYGISRNDKGSGMFHNLAMRCWGLIDIIDGKGSSVGRCVENDAEGNEIYSTFENKAGVGAHTIIGGSGKYKGILGEQAFAGLTTVKGTDGTSTMVIALKATWALP